MAANLPPPPIRDQMDSYTWEEWFRQLRDRTNSSLVSVSWSGIDFSGSSITDILSRPHNSLQTIQGGTSAEYYHLTNTEYTELQRNNNVTSVSANTTYDDSYYTVLVTATAKVMTLPAASTARIGKTWTTILGTDGYVDIVPNGTDVITLPNNDTDIRITTKGGSVSLKCLTATTWGII